MPNIKLYPHQKEAISRMKNGCILCGDTGSGKSRTAIAYYFTQNGGGLDPYKKMVKPKDLYIITTAKKRDDLDWEGEMTPFLISMHDEVAIYKHNVHVDSWNNIKKYKDVTDAFFIFDEQRVVGSGAWVKAFLKIAKHNDWILLSATPGDTWSDYIPVFIANGFYKNKTAFVDEHVIYKRGIKYPVIERYLNEGKLLALRKRLLINMKFEPTTNPIPIDIFVDYDKAKYKEVTTKRWDIWNNKPFKNSGGLCYGLRRVVNEDPSRAVAVLELHEKHPKVIIFYNFDYELEILKNLGWPKGCKVAEYNGHRHDRIPTGKNWVYLVQYTAGAEGWNCITTDTIIFYSQNYSYKTVHQSCGRINRINTPFTDLYYYHLKSRSGIDLSISRALRAKKNFNSSAWFAENFKQ